MNHLPNALTLFRIALVPALYGALFVRGAWGDWLAAGIFLAAALSDYYDGWVARRYNLQSGFGRMLDPIADKLVVATALLLLVYQGILDDLHRVAALIILCREILVSGLREYLSEIRVAMPVSALAKYKTTIQFLAILFLLTDEAGNAVWGYMHLSGLALLWVAALFTLITGYDYLRQSLKHT